MSIRPFHKGEKIGTGLLTRIIKEGLTREESLKLLQEPETIKNPCKHLLIIVQDYLYVTKSLYHVHKWIFPIAILIACTGVFGALLYMLGRASKFPEKPAGNESREYAGYVRQVVLVDNNPYKEGLETAWGLAVYLETDQTKLLFDTGPDPGVLERNAEKLGIDLSKIDFIVISHPHGDHTGA